MSFAIAIGLVALTAGLVLLVLAISLFWLQRRSRALEKQITAEALAAGELVVIRPHSCLYQGADRDLGDVKGNGIICLTSRRLIFAKLTGQRLDLERVNMARVSIADNFNDVSVAATGVQYLVVETLDGNRIGFLIQDARMWVEHIVGYYPDRPDEEFEGDGDADD